MSLLSLILLALLLPRSSAPALPLPYRPALISIDSKGTTRIGPVPVTDTNIRSAAFKTIRYLNGGNVSIQAYVSAPWSSVAESLEAMRRAGIPALSVRTPSTNR